MSEDTPRVKRRTKLALGLDYGTNSARALVVDVETGEELATAVHAYRSGESGILLDPKDPHLARQTPADYIDAFVETVREVGNQVDLSLVIGIGVDTTGSSPLAVDAENRPLAEQPEFRDDLAAQVWLWKDHTAFAEAAEITEKAREQGLPYLARCGGTYSSEWFWSKLLRMLRTAPHVFEAAASWMEVCDWIPARLCGIAEPRTVKRSRCAAGHKAMFEEDWGGLPSEAFLASLDPRLASIRGSLYDAVYESDQMAGRLSAHFAGATGLPEGIPVAVGSFDAHCGAVGSMAQPGTLVKIIGTSTCDCMVHPMDSTLPDIPGMCGLVRGSILPGFRGLEAGQSAVGDIFNWVSKFTSQSHEELSAAATGIAPGQSGLLALDWHNGNRTVLVDPQLTGMIVGLTLHAKPAEVYRACIEATAFGARTIVERMREYGVAVERVVACGGIADKSPLTMQIYADVLNMPVAIARSEQTCAVGSAIFGAVVGGAYATALDAQAKMAGVKDTTYRPDPRRAATYDRLYRLYSKLHDAFGTQGANLDLYPTMKELLRIREDSHGRS